MLGFLAYGAFYLLMFRGLQVVGSLVALTTITTGFRNVDWLAGGSSSMLGSHTTTFAMLMSYTAMLYSLHQLFAVHLLCYFAPFPRLITVGMDFLLAIVLLISSILLVTSDYIRHCDLYGNAIHCNNLKVGLVFEFLACGAFLCCAALIYSGEVGPWGVSEDREIGVQVSRGGDAPHHPLSPVVISTPIPSDKI